jgi:sulfur relay (sulfurtransferase) DsrF/TusC family protein
MDAVMIVIKSGPGVAPRVEEGLRLSAAMLGYDQMPVMVFLDDGVECLRAGAFEDSTLVDYLQASSDLAGIYALSESMEARGILPGDLDEKIEVTALDLDGLAGMMLECDAVATY